MKVIVKQWGYGADKVTTLASALQPDAMYEGGISERAHAQAQLNAECIGRLVEHLVEKGLCDFDEAKAICGSYVDIEPYVEPEPAPPSKWAGRAPREQDSDYRCPECGSPDCNGECNGDGQMGD